MSAIEQLTGTPLNEPIRMLTGPLAIIALLLFVAWRRQGGKKTIWYRVPVSQEGMTIASNEARVGEPTTSLVKVWSGIGQIVLLMVAGYAALRSHEDIGNFFVFLKGLPWIAGVVALVSLISAFLINILRTASVWLMRRATVIHCKDKSGQDCLAYFGEVPSLNWMYSAKPRVLLFAATFVLAALGAFCASAVISNLSRIDPTIAFGCLLAAIWIVPHVIVLLAFFIEARSGAE